MNLLVLTDHLTHSEESFLYLLLREMLKHAVCGRMDVASRGIDGNKLFFEKMAAKTLYGTQVSAMFSYREDAYFFKKKLTKLALRDYDAVLVLLPYPAPLEFWAFLETSFKYAVIVNKPKGVERMDNKRFLLDFPKICPPMKHCTSIDDIETFRQKFAIVLKPVLRHSNKEVVKIEGEKVSFARGQKMSYSDYLQSIQGESIDYLGVQFLENVKLGNKRIVICNNEVIGASLRTPKKGSWICSVSQGGRESATEVTPDEKVMLNEIDDVLQKHGIIFYGIDTLVDDNGKRVLSAVCANGIDGLISPAGYGRGTEVKKAAESLWNYFSKNS